MKFKSLYLVNILIIMSLFLVSCSASNLSLRDASLPDHLQTIDDLEFFPQNLMVYTNNIEGSKRLISKSEQLEQDQKFNERFFNPWTITKSSYPKKDIVSFLNYNLKGFKENQKTWTQDDLQKLRANIQEKTYPSIFKSAISLTHLYLRALPTSSPYYTKSSSNQKMYPFDDFQYTSLPIGTPLFVSHISKDRNWYFVRSAIVSGWVKTGDIGFVDVGFITRYQNGKYAAFMKDKVKLSSLMTFSKVANIGTVLPIKSINDKHIEVIFPIRNTEGAIEISYALIPKTDIIIKPAPLTPMLIAQVGNEMIGQHYGWGGLNGDRDCSSTMRDLFTPFGLWIPRNSAAQAKAWDFTSLENFPAAEKTKIIKAKAVPFASLLWMQGHIGLYVGTYKGKIAYYHNIWGIRVNETGNNLGRHILGRCVITSLEPGEELHEATDKTLLNRMMGISTIPHADL